MVTPSESAIKYSSNVSPEDTSSFSVLASSGPLNASELIDNPSSIAPSSSLQFSPEPQQISPPSSANVSTAINQENSTVSGIASIESIITSKIRAFSPNVISLSKWFDQKVCD